MHVFRAICNVFVNKGESSKIIYLAKFRYRSNTLSISKACTPGVTYDTNDTKRNLVTK